jgi:uncharacterized protein YoxC
MQEITSEELDKLIDEAKKAGKDVTDLEAEKSRAARAAATPPPKGERKEKQVSGGTRVIESTGPANEEDFK